MEVRRGPLAGVRVIELASYLTGPYCGQMLADLGAEVVKVEKPGGDPFRRFGRPKTYVSAPFANCNRGKRSVVVDLKEPGGADAVLGLLDEADVLVFNWRPDVAERLGLGDDVLAARNERLVRLYISGYGPDGPLAREPAYDTVVQARSGATRALWSTEEAAVLPGYPVDKLTAVMAAQAVLAALYAREATGRGERVDVAMLDAAAYLNFVDLFTGRTFVDLEPEDPRNLHASEMRPLRAADGWLVVAAVSAADIRGACDAVGHPEWADVILAIRDHVAMIREFFGRLESVTRTGPVDAWLERLRARDVPAARCASVDEHLRDPQVAHNGTYVIETWPQVGRVRSACHPARFGATGRLHASGPAPETGADTPSVLGRKPAGEERGRR